MEDKKYSTAFASNKQIDTVQTFKDNSKAPLRPTGSGSVKALVESRQDVARNIVVRKEETRT